MRMMSDAIRRGVCDRRHACLRNNDDAVMMHYGMHSDRRMSRVPPDEDERAQALMALAAVSLIEHEAIEDTPAVTLHRLAATPSTLIGYSTG